VLLDGLSTPSFTLVLLTSAWWHAWILYAGYGLYYGAFQGAASALVSDLVPENLRGTAYGIFNAALGIAAFPASLVAGVLWDWYGPAAPFFFGGGLSILAVIGFLMLPAGKRERARDR
jgi:MFS family permease